MPASAARKDYITESGGKFTVHAESGKPMGTYPTKAAAEKRLREIEYFKHHDSARTDADREPNQDDMNAAARGLRMVSMSLADLDDLIREHEGKSMFASKAIVKAAKQMRAAKARTGARRDAEEDADVERLQRQLEAQEKKREGLNRDSQEYADITKHMDRIHRDMEKMRNFKPETHAERARNDAEGHFESQNFQAWKAGLRRDYPSVRYRSVSNTIIAEADGQEVGRYRLKEATGWVKRKRRDDATESEVSERIRREYNRGHPEKQAQAIAYSELGEPKGDAATAEIMDALRVVSAGADRLDARLDALEARGDAGKKFKPGQRVTFNGGFPGTVVRYYSEGMIEVRGERGLVCIPEEDAKPLLSGSATGKKDALEARPDAAPFSAEQIERLRREYGRVSRVDPGSDTYKRLIALLDRLSKEQLKQLAEAGVPFVSGLARNRV